MHVYSIRTSMQQEGKVNPLASGSFYYNRGLQRPYTGTCTILQETINRFLYLLIVLLKGEFRAQYKLGSNERA